MKSSLQQTVPLDVRVELVSALVEFLARREGIRALHLKGPAAARVLGIHRTSSDVDLLVEPGSAERFLELLEEQGFVGEKALRDSPWSHSLDLVSDEWGMHVDAHFRYPGTAVDDRVLFERLWRDHITVELGGRPCRTPDRAAHALLIGLHAARSPYGSLKWSEADAARSALSPAEEEELVRLAAELQARPALGTRWVDFACYASDSDRETWAAIGSKDSAAVWWHRIKHLEHPVREIPQILRASRAFVNRLVAHHDGNVAVVAQELLRKIASVAAAALRDASARLASRLPRE